MSTSRTLKPSKAQIALLEAIEREEVEYTQSTGAYGARNMYSWKIKGDRRGRTVPTNSLAVLETRGWVVVIPLSIRLGGPTTVIRTLTPMGTQILAQAREKTP
jgi:hypothetical protein